MLAGLLMVAFAAASWGTWSLFVRPTGLPATTTAPIVFAVMGLATLPLALRTPRVTWNRRLYGLLCANAAFDALNVITFFAALTYTTVAIAVLTHYVAPIMIAVSAPWIERTRGRGTELPAVIALAGLVVVLEPWREPAQGAAIGAVLGVLSAVCYTGNMFVVRRLAMAVGATRAMSYHSLIAAVVLLPLLVEGRGAVSASDLGLVALGGVTLGAMSGIIFAVGLTKIDSARAAVLTYAEPLVAVAVGVLVWDEPLRPLAILGGAMVLGAGIYVARLARNHEVHAARQHRDARI